MFVCASDCLTLFSNGHNSKHNDIESVIVLEVMGDNQNSQCPSTGLKPSFPQRWACWKLQLQELLLLKRASTAGTCPLLVCSLCGTDVKKGDPSNTFGGNASWHTHSGKQYSGSSRRLEILYDSAITLLGIYSQRYRCGKKMGQLHLNVLITNVHNSQTERSQNVQQQMMG